MPAGTLRLALTLLALPFGPRAASPGITWAAARDGIERTEFAMAERGVLQAVQVIALRIDPARIHLDLMARTRYAGLRGA